VEHEKFWQYRTNTGGETGIGFELSIQILNNLIALRWIF
jgi:hypothetical protein